MGVERLRWRSPDFGIGGEWRSGTAASRGVPLSILSHLPKNTVLTLVADKARLGFMPTRVRPPDWDEIHVALGRRVAKVRVERGLSQEDLANESGISRTSLQNLEHAKTAPGIDHLVLIARAMGITVVDLLPKDIKGLR
ncbi:helix-turn-helix domain-containing protein [Phytoactinopolyspora endophytica]|uniref:helix-turn-helix domain-containing protein n=1 Tax=Phytoactinopolyspora endophytica TaxID=1642495 RepID=UPI00101C62D7|nr:helix-turn-helix transcriptional regulator [Phytoactinopolyspora endophytica]